MKKIITYKEKILLEQRDGVDGWSKAPRGKTADYTDGDGTKWEVKKVLGIYLRKKKSSAPTTTEPADCKRGDGWSTTTNTSDYTDYDGTKYKVKKCADNKFYKKKESATPPPSTSLPAWVSDKGKCIEKHVDGLKPYDSVNAKPEQIVGDWGGDIEVYFESNNRFVYYDKKDNKDLVGTWKCNGDILILYIVEINKEWRSDSTDGEWKERVVVTTPVDCKPFTNKKEADEFRLWVNTNYPEIAADIPGLPATMTDKKLSRRGKCTSTHIRTAAKHKINDVQLIDLFRKKEVVTQEKNPHEERNKWMEKNKSRFDGGEIKTFISKDFELKVYQKIKDGNGFRYFPPNDKGELFYRKYDVSFRTPLGQGQYKLEEEPTNESIKRWLDIMNKTGRVSINEQIDVPGTYTSYEKKGESPIIKKEDDPIKKKDADTLLDSKKKAYKDALVSKYGFSLDADPIEVRQDKWDVIDLNSHPIYKNTSLFTEPGKDFLYLQKGEVTIDKPQQTKIIDAYKAKGYVAVPCDTTQTNDFLTIIVKLHEKHPSIFKIPYCMVVKESFADAETLDDFNKFLDEKNTELRNSQMTDKTTCRQLINMYKNASDKKFAVDDEAAGLELAKQYITRCNTQHKFHFGTNKNLEYILNSRKKRVGMYGFRD